MCPEVEVSCGQAFNFHYEPIEDGGKRPIFEQKSVEWEITKNDLKDSHIIRFVIEDE